MCYVGLGEASFESLCRMEVELTNVGTREVVSYICLEQTELTILRHCVVGINAQCAVLENMTEMR